MEFNLFQNNSPLKIAEKKGWKLFKFTEILEDDTKNATKIKKENYLSNGTYPIIDQGKQFVAGYCNDEVNLYKNYPVIIFGDHTRIIKYINFPIYLGADGVKLFKVKEGINVKYIYYFLENVDLPNDGYSRHYKYLKDVIIAIPNLETQNKIVEVLDKAQELIDKRKEQIEVLDALVKSRFIEMFGDPVSNPKGWRETNLGDLFVGDVDYRGKTPPKSAEGIPLISAANVKMGKVDLSNADYISEEDYKNWLKRGIPNYNDILITTEAPMGRVALYPKGLYQLSRRVIAFEPDKERLNPYFALYTISSESWQKRLYKKVRGSTVPRILKPDILSQQIQTPPIELQNEFEKFVNQVDKLKSQMETSLKELEDNFNSLMQKAFKGELF